MFFNKYINDFIVIKLVIYCFKAIYKIYLRTKKYATKILCVHTFLIKNNYKHVTLIFFDLVKKINKMFKNK